jgi:hypothetical protein
MAGMKFTADIDVEGIIKLRQEINKLKNSLKAVAGIPNSDAAIKQLEKEIEAATKKLEEYENKYLQIQKLKHDIDSSNDAVKKAKKETAALQYTNKWIVANTEAVIETDKQIKQLKKSFVSLSDSEKTGSSGTGILRQVQQLAAQRLVEEESIRRTIKAQKDQIIQSRAEEGSITALRKQIILLTKDYDDLGRTRRNGDAGKALLAQIANVQKELSAAEQASGRFQRNVGNYASAWNGLSFSVQQVARELPSLAVSANTFFLAISNNLPILVDEIAKARKEYAAFKAEIAAGNKDVKAVAPVWQQLTKSLISWQTALVVGLTLLSVHGKEIISWIGSLGQANKKLAETYQLTKDFQKAVSKSTNEVLTSIEKLSQGWKKLGGDMKSQEKYILENRDAFNKTGIVINTVADAENLLITNKENFIKAIMDKAKAAAVMELAAKEYEKSIQAMLEADAKAEKGVTFGDRFKSWLVRSASGKDLSGTLQQEDLSPEAFAKKAEENLRKKAEEYQKEMVALIKRALGIDEESNKEIKNAGGESANTLIEGSVGAIEAAISLKQAELKKMTNRKDYAKTNAEIEALENKLKAITGKTTKEYNSIIDQQKKINDLLDKQAIERRRKEEDLENQAFQARINTMADGEAKIRAQRALDNKKEIQDLKRQREDYIRTEIEYQKKVFDEQEELKAQKTKGYKKKTFDPTSVSVDTSALDSINQDTLKGQANDVAKYYKEVLSKYQDYTAQRIAIEKQFLNDEKRLKEGMSKAQNNSEKEQYANALKELNKQKKQAITSISKSEIEDSGIWKMLMGDVDSLPTDTLEKLLSDAEQLVKATNLSASDMKAMMDTINNARQNLIARNPFKTLKEEYEKYRKAVKKGDTQGASTSWSNVEKASEAIKNNISILGSSLASLGNTFSDELGEGIQKAVDVINDGIAAFEAFGKTGEKSAGDTVKGISGIIGIITTLVGTVMNAFDSTAEEQARNLEYQRRQEGYWDSINYQVERYLELLKEATANDYFEIAGKSLTTLEESRKKAYEDIIKSMPVGDVDHTTFGLAQLFNYGKFFDFRQYPDAKEIFDFINANGGYDLDNKLISEEAIWAMKNNADIWSKLPDWMQQAIDKFVELNDQAKDLEETLNKDLFQATSQSIEEAILEGLKGGKRGIADFGEDFEEIMRNALLQSFVIDQLRGKAQEFYKKYTLLADSDNNGKLDLTAEEISDLRKDWNDIIRAATEEAKNIDAIVGGSSSSSQESSKKGFATMSQDSADELNGRFTALQIAGEEIKNQNQLQTMSILDLKAGMLSIGANTSGIKDIAGETRDLIRLSYEAITDIRDNTNVMVKPIQQMAADIAEVKRNTNGLSKK